MMHRSHLEAMFQLPQGHAQRVRESWSAVFSGIFCSCHVKLLQLQKASVQPANTQSAAVSIQRLAENWELRQPLARVTSAHVLYSRPTVNRLSNASSCKLRKLLTMVWTTRRRLWEFLTLNLKRNQQTASNCNSKAFHGTWSLMRLHEIAVITCISELCCLRKLTLCDKK